MTTRGYEMTTRGARAREERFTRANFPTRARARECFVNTGENASSFPPASRVTEPHFNSDNESCLSFHSSRGTSSTRTRASLARPAPPHWRLRRYGWYASSFGSTQAENDTKLTNPSSSLNRSATASIASSPSSTATCARTTCLNCALVT